MGSWGGKLARSGTAARTPAEEAGPTALMQHRLARRFSFIAVLEFSMETMLLETAHVWNAPGKGFFLREMCGH